MDGGRISSPITSKATVKFVERVQKSCDGNLTEKMLTLNDEIISGQKNKNHFYDLLIIENCLLIFIYLQNRDEEDTPYIISSYELYLYPIQIL